MLKHVAFLALTAGLAGAQLPLISERAVTFAPRLIPSDSTTTVWRTDYGSYQKHFEHQRILELQIRVVGTVEPRFGCAWFFYGRDRENGMLEIFGSGDRLAQLGAGNTVTLRIDSPMISGSDYKYAALQRREQGGVRPWGWAFAMFQGGRIITVTGSTPECTELGRKHAQEFIGRKQREAAKTNMRD